MKKTMNLYRVLLSSGQAFDVYSASYDGAAQTATSEAKLGHEQVTLILPLAFAV